MTGVFTICKICKESKDDALFKWQKGKRVGLVCRACDLEKKRTLYATDETVRAKAINRSRLDACNNKARIAETGKRWRSENQDKIKARRKTYHVENRERIIAKTQVWLSENRERHNARCVAYYYENAGKISERAIQYYLKTKDVADLRMKIWREKNKKKQTAYYRAYMLEKAKRVPAWSERSEILEFYANCPDGYEVDHIIPLFGKLVSGLHVIRNLQYLTASENSKKSNKFNPLEFEL